MQHTIDFAGGELSDRDRITDVDVNASIVITKDTPGLKETLRTQTRAVTLKQTSASSLYSFPWHMIASQAERKTKKDSNMKHQ